MPKKPRAPRAQRDTSRSRARGGAHQLLDLAWDLDTSTPEEAWTHPWRSGIAAARLATDLVFDELKDTHHVLTALRGIASASYEEVQTYRYSLHALPNARHARWLRAGCLILEAMLSNSAAGGQLYGRLLWAARPDEELDGDRVSRLLLNARVEDALGLRPLRGKRPAVEDAFRKAWNAGKFRVAYLVAEASRGIR